MASHTQTSAIVLSLAALMTAGCTDGITADVPPPTATMTPSATPSSSPTDGQPTASDTQTAETATPSETESGTATATFTPTPTIIPGPGVTGELKVPEEYTTIQSALDAAANGAEIIVSPGTYMEDLNFNGKTLTLRSEQGPGATIIEGTGEGTVVRLSSGEGVQTRLKGFTIKGGIGILDGGNYRLGGGVYVSNASPTLENLIITGNYAQYGGGLTVERGDVTLLGLRIFANEAELFGGGVAILDAEVSARGLLVWDNEAEEAGGLYLNDTIGVVSNSYFNNNRAGDSGGGVGIRYCEGELELLNNVFAENRAPEGASVYFLASESLFTSNIVTGSLGGAAIVSDSENYTPILSFNDIWDNEGGNVGGGISTVTGAGNIGEDPLFQNYTANQDPLDDLLTLEEGSPCIDAGPDGDAYLDADGSRNDIGLYGGPYADDRAYGDEDEDGMPDLWEELNGLNPYEDDAGEDPDEDGLTNLEEYELGTQALAPDTDNDGVDDGDEVEAGQDPLDPKDNRPTADAGNNVYVEPGEVAVVNGSASTDPNDDALSYQWLLVLVPEGSALTQGSLSGADTVEASFTPDIDGVYGLELKVSDGQATSLPDRVDVITAGTIYVSPDGLLRKIQDGIDRAETGQRVLVAPGTYNEALVVSKKRIRIESIGGPDVTTIYSPKLQPVIIFEKNLNGREDGFRAELVGFTLTNGFGNSVTFGEPIGGGILITTAAPLIENCIIVRNAAENGAGIAVFGGGIDLLNSRVEENGAEGEGGGIYIYDAVLGSHIRQTSFSRNFGGTGGGLYARASDVDGYPLELTNNIFDANTAERSGGAIYISSNHEGLQVFNNVLVDNKADAGAGISLIGDGSGAKFHGNIIAFNDGSGVQIPVGTTMEVSFAYNDIFGNGVNNYEGAQAQAIANRDGNISEDPLFARLILGIDDEDPPILVLRPGSPAIDAGPPASDYNDQDGSRNDMGAYGGPHADLSDVSDTDGDGIPDYWEEDYGLDADTADSDSDPDMDGASNLDEYLAGSNPEDPDTDGDGVNDGDEIDGSQDPVDPSDNLPVAMVAEDILRVAVGNVVTMDGSQSSDPQGSTLTYAWSLELIPEDSVLTQMDLTGADLATATFLPDVAGTYLLNLIVGDGQALSEPALLTVVASEEIVVGEGGTHDTIQGAIDAAGNTDTIKVREGVYVEDLNFGGKSIVVESIFGPEVTIIQGTSFSSVVSFLTYERPEATLRGFTIKGGFGTVLTTTTSEGGATPSTVEFVAGGGILIDGGASPTLENLWVIGNDADIGGGIYIRDGNPTLRSLLIEDNDAAQAGGGLALVDTTARVESSTIRLNDSQGVGGIYIDGGGSVIESTIVVENKGSGTTGLGGIHVFGCTDEFVLRNSTIVGNSGRGGSSLILDGCTGLVDSNIMAFGTAGAGVVLVGETLPTFIYNDVYGHAGDLNYAGDEAGALQAGGSISQDPLFVEYESGEGSEANLHLRQGSPCMDGGNPAPEQNDPDGTQNDMGAYGGPLAQ